VDDVRCWVRFNTACRPYGLPDGYGRLRCVVRSSAAQHLPTPDYLPPPRYPGTVTPPPLPPPILHASFCPPTCRLSVRWVLDGRGRTALPLRQPHTTAFTHSGGGFQFRTAGNSWFVVTVIHHRTFTDWHDFLLLANLHTTTHPTTRGAPFWTFVYTGGRCPPVLRITTTTFFLPHLHRPRWLDH